MIVKVVFISAFLLAALGVFLLVHRKKKKPFSAQEIPGVEQMAKTISFWAGWHRKKQQ